MSKAKIVFVLLALSLTSCLSAADKSVSYSASNTNTASSAPASRATTGGSRQPNAPEAQVSLDQAETTQNQTTQNQPTVTERKIIRNADLQLETDAPETVQQKITSIAESKNGFVIESSQSSSDVKAGVRDTVRMTVRVPAAKFNEALDEMRKTANRVITETVKGEDVTEEFIDVEARLKAKKSLEAQFLEIMKQAKSVEDALKVQRELAEVRSEIEKIEGRLKFLENQTSFSTIKIQIQTPAAFSANAPGFFDKLKESAGDGFDAALNFVLGLITFLIAILPFFVLVVLPLFFVLRYFWRKHGRQKLASEIAREEIKNV